MRSSDQLHGRESQPAFLHHKSRFPFALRCSERLCHCGDVATADKYVWVWESYSINVLYHLAIDENCNET